MTGQKLSPQEMIERVEEGESVAMPLRGPGARASHGAASASPPDGFAPYRALDLFCKAGGVSMGLARAGFDVVGVDIEPQPNYPFTFVQADALRSPFDLRGFDFIWASPPCQAFVSLRHMYNAKAHADLIPATRAMLQASGRPYAIENVNGAPLRSALRLCGTQFGLGTDDAELWRHRHVETNFPLPLTLCRHREKPRVIGVYGGHGRDRRRKANTQDFSTDERREAMGIDWMNGTELSQAIPPAYSEFIGRAARAILAQAVEPASAVSPLRASVAIAR